MFDQVETEVFSAIRDRLGIATPISLLLGTSEVERVHSGVGRFTNFSMNDDAFREFRDAAGKRVVDGPYLESPDLQHGACSLLFLDGPADCTLEFAAYGDTFPESLIKYRLLDFPDVLEKPKSE